ncbi:H-2 class II histocompatibility antigen, E-S beta chain-like [Cyprinus carpio]|uniref:H-2 class II histocompatibility antigen, E-S beta chain-like n=1 Tax=Cyprinus carpio TaxID=7962 RepID=A0A9Q9XPY3_CYPCA|nr:H-2 class II histocompatibility antigen, E-S beta chain-like [Cyprinus carpio]
MSLLKLLIFHPILMLSAFTGTAHGYYEYMTAECVYSTSDYSDMVLLLSYSFNHVMHLQYNSSVGKFVGYTEQGVKHAEGFNKNQAYMQQVKAAVDTFCRPNAQILDSAVRDKSVKPMITLRSARQADGSRPAVLMCSAYEFYPKKIKVSWLRDGKEMTSDVTSTMEMANGNWFYQIHSHLEYTPKSGEKISCMVEHASFSKPMIYDWDPSLPEGERNKIAIGASGLVLGIIIAAAGLIYYKKKSAGRILVPN